MKTKEETLKEFDEEFAESGVIGSRTFKEYLPNKYKAIQDFISQALAQTREETIKEVENVLYEAMDMGYSKRDIIDKINKLKK